MGSEDCVDAVEKLLRLGLKGEQEREIVRVTVDCCLQVGPVRSWWRYGVAVWCGVSVSACMRASRAAGLVVSGCLEMATPWLERALAKPFCCALGCAACHPT